MTSVIKMETGWDDLRWRKELETFGDDDAPTIALSPNGEADAIW